MKPAKRPPKERVLIIERPKSPEAKYKLCVDQLWDVFKQNVEKIKAAAEEHSDWISFIITLGTHPAIWPGPEGVEPTVGPDIVTALQKQKEIEEGTKRAAAERDQAIKNNCKIDELP